MIMEYLSDYVVGFLIITFFYAYKFYKVYRELNEPN